MPSLRGKWTGTDGAVLRVRIGLSGPDRKKLRAAGSPIPQPIDATALIDTGAEVTCADPAVLARVRLPFAGVAPVNMPAGGGLLGGTQFACSLVVPHPSGNPRDDFAVSYLAITELPIGALGYEMLIGRDVLARCVLRFDGPALAFTLDY